LSLEQEVYIELRSWENNNWT